MYVLKLIEEANGNYVFKQEKIEIGATYDGYLYIKNTSSFEKGSRFLTKGAFVLVQDR